MFKKKPPPQPVEVADVKVLIENDSTGSAFFAVGANEPAVREVAVVTLVAGLALENLALVFAECQPYIKAWVWTISEMEKAPTWEAVDLLGADLSISSERERIDHLDFAQVGTLEAHADGAITTSWTQGLATPRRAAMSLRLAAHAALQALSPDGCELLANTLMQTIATFQQHPEILEEGRRAHMANAITMATLQRGE